MEPYRVASSCLSLLLFVTFEGSSGEVHGVQQAAAATRLKPSRSTSKGTKFVSCFGKGQPTDFDTLIWPTNDHLIWPTS
ncbi:MAG: hypothetical protein DMG53_01855 [Acidobacteria bacterium]|nr:MAG: hypothetical protein DMG53_01855 [Acidobacteriota bacterium]